MRFSLSRAYRSRGEDTSLTSYEFAGIIIERRDVIRLHKQNISIGTDDMKTEFNDGILTVCLGKRVDSANCGEVENEIFDAIGKYSPETAVLDCSELTYIASAGLRVVLMLAKSVKKLSAVNVSREVYEIFELTGYTEMIEVKRVLRKMSVDGCRIVGRGFSSEVYRYDRETVIKLYGQRVTLERIINETKSAKKSFVAGIPTAIPYDVVECGDRYGTVFELIDADTLSKNFMDHPEKFDELMEKYVALLKHFHSTPAINGDFPNIREKYHLWASGLKKYMTDDEVAVLDRLIDAVPTRQTMIHVDCHSGNIMVQNGNLMFVDMADVSIGHPLFDIGAEYFHYVIMRETSLGAKVIFGVEPEDAELPLRVWDRLVERYFDKCSDSQMADVRKMLKYFGCLRCLIMVAKHAHIEYDAAMELVNRQRRELMPFADEAAELFSRADEFFK